MKPYPKFYDFGVEAVVLGCMEFGCIDSSGLDITVIDSSIELAKYTVKMALTE